jgi:hypothetical protein
MSEVGRLTAVVQGIIIGLHSDDGWVGPYQEVKWVIAV